MPPTGVLIAVPTTGYIHRELAALLINLTHTAGTRVGIHFEEAQLVDNARNLIVRRFLATDYEWLLMIDSDNVPPPNVLDLLKHGKKIVGAACFSSQRNIPYPLIIKKRGAAYGVKWDIGPLTEVDATGAACILIHREVLERMRPPWFEFGRNEQGIITYSEDFVFYRRAKEMGYKVYVDPRIQCKHYKTVDLKAFNQVLGEVSEPRPCPKCGEMVHGPVKRYDLR